MKTRDQIIKENPLEQALVNYGIKTVGKGDERKANCPFHKDKTPSFCVNIAKQIWHCQSCKAGGSVIDLIALKEGVNAKVIMKRLGESPDKWEPNMGKTTSSVKPAPVLEEEAVEQPSGKPKLVKAYDYRNAKGDLVYQACRLESPNPNKPCGYSKTFRQRRPAGEENKWLWDMEGVERVLYQLPKVLLTKNPVVICEGEKDADNITAIGYIGTTNVGGAGKWLDAYSEYLKDKDVILCGDNDEVGRDHMDKVFESLAGKVKSVRIVKVPAPFKDLSEWIEGTNWSHKMTALELGVVPPEEIQHREFSKMVESSPMFDKGLNIPIQSMAELEVEFKQSIARAETHSLDLTRWLPSLGKSVRPLVPGEVVAILAGTGVGKTALASNLGFNASPLKTLFFQQELPGSLMFERTVAMGTRTPSREVYRSYQGVGNGVNWRESGNLDHIFVCQSTRITAEKVEELILKSELKIGERPALIIVDYLQLCGGSGERYDRVTDAAEGLKVVAKNTNTIIVMLSQIARKRDQVQVDLMDGKESGAIENSSGLVLGAWRDEEDSTLLHLKVLKNTKGFSGQIIPCNFDGERLIINERVVDETDVPEPKARRQKEESTVESVTGLPYKD